MNQREDEEKLLKQQQAEAQIEEILRQALTQGAKTRLGNVKLVNQELYLKTAQAIIYLYNSGELQGRIDETQLKKLLEKLSAKRDITIKRK